MSKPLEYLLNTKLRSSSVLFLSLLFVCVFAAGHNACADQPCTLLCLPQPGHSHSCVCPDGVASTRLPSGELQCQCPSGYQLMNGTCVKTGENRTRTTFPQGYRVWSYTGLCLQVKCFSKQKSIATRETISKFQNKKRIKMQNKNCIILISRTDIIQLTARRGKLSCCVKLFHYSYSCLWLCTCLTSVINRNPEQKCTVKGGLNVSSIPSVAVCFAVG